uniref:Secreted protein n=1 Tax=Calidris pygmaea TaxID=425635 RepID=A0A8C3JUB2_9CHAR
MSSQAGGDVFPLASHCILVLLPFLVRSHQGSGTVQDSTLDSACLSALPFSISPRSVCQLPRSEACLSKKDGTAALEPAGKQSPANSAMDGA